LQVYKESVIPFN